MLRTCADILLPLNRRFIFCGFRLRVGKVLSRLEPDVDVSNTLRHMQT